MSVDADVSKSLAEAARAFDVFNAGLAGYQADVVRAMWNESEGERANLHVALDDYLDAFGAAHKRLDQARRGAG